VRRCRGAEYRISVTNRATAKAARLVVDGRPIEGSLVPYAPAGKVVAIACEV
jgi:cellobiose phosphorylase